ncbi:PhoP family transcriptional regulator [Clostridioides difficile]|nr:PhoP family transcriptional regulator [Clostridioides difficile]
MTYTILIAEDDGDIVNILKIFLESSEYRVLTADNGETAFDIVQKEKIDLAVLDIMMPKMDGFELTRKIRETKNIPIIILTAKIEDSDSILGLNLGADDYLTKPFNPLVIVARVAAQLRRFYNLGSNTNDNNSDGVLSLGDLILDTATLTLKKKGQEIVITPNEFKLLSFLMKSPGRVYTKSQLCEAINGEFYENYENAIMVHISHLREKIEDDPRNPNYIKNVRGIGYKIECI